MGRLCTRHDSGEVILHPEHTFGRSKSCLLRLTHPGVSALHAVVFFSDDSWFLKDLGSRNGTYLAGRRLGPGLREPLRKGCAFELGLSGPCFELVDESPPLPLLLADGDSSFCLWIDRGSAVVPSEEAPDGILFQGPSGDWYLESESQVERLEEHGHFSLSGRNYRLIAPRGVPATLVATDHPQLRLADAELLFSVSSDEEHVELALLAGDRSFSFGERAHHYLLVTLARERQKHEAEGSADVAGGWIERSLLERMLLQTQQHINLAVWRARRQFAEAGFVDAASIVERRGSALRLGTRRIRIARS